MTTKDLEFEIKAISFFEELASSYSKREKIPLIAKCSDFGLIEVGIPEKTIFFRNMIKEPILYAHPVEKAHSFSEEYFVDVLSDIYTWPVYGFDEKLLRYFIEKFDGSNLQQELYKRKLSEKVFYVHAKDSISSIKSLIERGDAVQLYGKDKKNN